MNRKIVKSIVVFVLIIMTLIFEIVGVLNVMSEKKYKDDGAKTTAIIDDIKVTRKKVHNSANRKYKNKHQIDADVYVIYEVEGVQYREELGSYNSNMEVGDEVEIYYMKDNPKDIIKVGANKILGMIFMGVGALTGIILVVVCVFTKRR